MEGWKDGRLGYTTTTNKRKLEVNAHLCSPPDASRSTPLVRASTNSEAKHQRSETRIEPTAQERVGCEPLLDDCCCWVASACAESPSICRSVERAIR